MIEHNETLADIVAEMRRFGQRHWMHDEGQSVRMFADRLEAAHEREKAKLLKSINSYQINRVGNEAAMREALEAVNRIAYTAKNDFDVFAGIERIRRISGAALAKPPRNCDVGTAEEQERRFLEYCRKYRKEQAGTCLACPLLGLTSGVICGLPWAQMPYEEGEEQ